MIFAALLFATTVASVTFANAEDVNDYRIKCQYLERGPAGTDGNVLAVTMKKGSDSHTLDIAQVDDEIQIGTREDYDIDSWLYDSSPRADVATCWGPAPTVHNIDRIVIHALPQARLSLVLDARGAGQDGFLAPGVTPEKHGSDIEIRAKGQLRTFGAGSELLLVGGRGSDSFGLGSRSERLGVNLNVAADGDHPDADLLPNLQFTDVTVDLGAGADRLSAGGAKGGLGRFDSFVDLLADGGAGNDRMSGHDGMDLMTGGKGDDVVRGGAGDDAKGYAEFGITGGPGRDRTYGGLGDDMMGGVDNATTDDGRDFVFGGPGFDRFIGSNDKRRDVIDCGGDRTGRLDYEKGLDQLRHCGR